jgi:2'-5' RNA ligase
MLSDWLQEADHRATGAGPRRVYFALRPDVRAAAEATALAERLRREHGLTSRPIPAARLHVSLNWLGRPAPAQTIGKACEAVSGLRLKSFVIAFNRAASFGGGHDRPLVLWGEEGVIGVELLHAALHAALARPGIVRGPPPAFEPHMTRMRGAQPVAEEFVAPVSWRVRELVLIESGEGRQAALGRWPMG